MVEYSPAHMKLRQDVFAQKIALQQNTIGVSIEIKYLPKWIGGCLRATPFFLFSNRNHIDPQNISSIRER